MTMLRGVKFALALLLTLTACSSGGSKAHQADLESPLPPTTANVGTPVSPATATPALEGQVATDAAVAEAVNMLFTQTAVAHATAIVFSAAYPSPVPTEDPDQDPAYAARLCFSAFYQNDPAVVARYTCDQQLEQTSENMFWMGLLTGGLQGFFGQLIPGVDVGVGVDTSHLIFTVQERNAGRATVHMGGELTVTVAGGFQTDTVDELLTMIYEDGRWKVCETGS